MNREDGQVYSFVYCNFLILLSTTVCGQNINKQILNKADETLTDYSFLSWYHYTKSKNYLKRRYRIRHWIPMFIGTPCRKEYIGSYTYIYICTCKSRVERSRLVEPTPSSRLASSRWTGCVKLTETQELIVNLST